MENNGMQPPQPPTPQGPPQPAQPVMDIQPPRPTTPGWPSAAPAPTTGVGSTPGTAPSESAPGMTSAPASWGAPAAPASPVPAPVTAPVPAPTMSDINAPQSPLPQGPVPAPGDQLHDDKQPEQHSDHNPAATSAHTGPKHRAPIGVIIGAIAIAVLLAAVAIFAYLKTQKSSDETTKVSIPTIGVSDVSATEKQLNDSLDGIDDTKDFAAADLSDAALGLQ